MGPTPPWSTAFLVCGFVLQLAAPAAALDLSSHVLVYAEDFEGETGFPTTPEVNTLAVGANSTIGVDGNSNPFSGMAISGGAAIGSIHSEVPPSRQNATVPSTFTDSFAMRATFDGFSIGVSPADGTASAGVVAAFGPVPTLTSVVQAGLGLIRNLGSESGLVVVSYEEPPAPPVTSTVPISASALTAVLGGAAFTVDLAFDKTTLVATGSVEVAGFGVFTAAPVDATAVASITSSTPVSATNLFLTEHLGMDADVEMEDLLVFVAGAPVVDEVLIERSDTATGTIHSDLVTVDLGGPEVKCPGAFDLCNADVPGATEGGFDIGADSVQLIVGNAGGPTLFSSQAFNGFVFSDLDLGASITGTALTTDIPGLSPSRVGFTADSVSIDLSGLTVSPGQSFTVVLSTTTVPPSVPGLSTYGVALLLMLGWAMTRKRLNAVEAH